MAAGTTADGAPRAAEAGDDVAIDRTRGAAQAGEGVEIGEMRDDEAPAVVRLWHACGLTRPWNDPRADLDQARAGTTSTILVARRAGAVVGTVMAGVDGHRGWVYYLGVDPAEQGRGLGSALLSAAETWLGASGARKVQLMVRTGNPAAGFYAGHGYEVQDCVVLGRWLEPAAR
ncbi:GNAT family acetyltransferase [Georgenia ruanii]|uniref:GNAT family acetyltransferase n=1 Tax=Georgenia ruanii TaxID=348442 RepID=A0A7J9US44_9MICO|nr:GNAT family acetyltransferase [Georgenia ruanii]MPV87441.1 GNAT family acetyltransferase [Georgenia ruanii]